MTILESRELTTKEKKKLAPEIKKHEAAVKAELKKRGIKADVKVVKLKKPKTPVHNLKLNEGLKEGVDTILNGSPTKIKMSEKTADQVVNLWDEWGDLSNPYVSLLYKMEKQKVNDNEIVVEKIGLKKNGEVFDIPPLKRFLLKNAISGAETISIPEYRKSVRMDGNKKGGDVK